MHALFFTLLPLQKKSANILCMQSYDPGPSYSFLIEHLRYHSDVWAFLVYFQVIGVTSISYVKFFRVDYLGSVKCETQMSLSLSMQS